MTVQLLNGFTAKESDKTTCRQTKQLLVLNLMPNRAVTEQQFTSLLSGTDVDVAVMCAAVADYRPESMSSRKIKREKDSVPEIKLVKNPDIAAAVGKIKTNKQLLVGFALETDNAEQNALEKLRRKNLDMIVLNSLEDKDSGFGVDTNKVTIVDSSGEMLRLPVKPKKDVAVDIVDHVVLKLK